ncbi:hypothetical protein ABZP36_010752 [Zizania latifolia]
MRCVLLRLPLEPVHLAAVTAVSKNLRGHVVGDNGSFLRAFRAAHDGVPPYLGIFANHAVRGKHCPFFTSTAASVGDLSPAPRRSRPSNAGGPYGASVICGCNAGGGGDDDCHSVPYHVVVAFSNRHWRQDSLGDDRVYASIWSSQTWEWSSLYSMKGNLFFDYKRSAIVALAGWGQHRNPTIPPENSPSSTDSDATAYGGIYIVHNQKRKARLRRYAGVLGEHILVFHRNVTGDGAAVAQWNMLAGRWRRGREVSERWWHGALRRGEGSEWWWCGALRRGRGAAVAR